MISSKCKYVIQLVFITWTICCYFYYTSNSVVGKNFKISGKSGQERPYPIEAVGNLHEVERTTQSALRTSLAITSEMTMAKTTAAETTMAETTETTAVLKKFKKKTVNLIYYDAQYFYGINRMGNGNFGDEISKFIVKSLINYEKYDLVFNFYLFHEDFNEEFWSDDFEQLKNVREKSLSSDSDLPQHPDYNLVSLGSYMARTIPNSYVYGTGTLQQAPYSLIGTKDDKVSHFPENINIAAVRGPKTRQVLVDNGYPNCPEIYGDPGLLMKILYQPEIVGEFKSQGGSAGSVCLLPHYVHNQKYNIFYNQFRSTSASNKLKNHLTENSLELRLLDATWPWQQVVNSIYSCQVVISSSLHGLIISDAYNIPNVWLTEYSIRKEDNDWKFLDYFESQGREGKSLRKMEEFRIDGEYIYRGGNRVDLEVLRAAFPFS